MVPNAQATKTRLLRPTVDTRVADPVFYLNAGPDLDPDRGTQTNADPDPLKVLSHEIDFKTFDKNLQNLA